MVNPLYLVGKEISTLSLSLQMWPQVTAGINLFQIDLSRGSTKWRMFGIILRKWLSLFFNPLENAKLAACGCVSAIVNKMLVVSIFY